MRNLAVGLFLGATLAAGCGGSDPGVVDSTQAVAATVDYAYAVSWDSAFLWSGAEPFDPLAIGVLLSVQQVTGTQVTAAVTQVVDNVDTVFSDGCLNASANGNVATFELDGCDGPFGLRNAKGTVTLTYAVSGDNVEIQAASSGLTVEKSTVNLDASAIYTAATGGARQLEVTSNSTGQGPNGNSVPRVGDYTIAWTAGVSCVTIDGSVGNTTNSVDSARFQGFQICDTGCPLAGTVSRLDQDTGLTVILQFNGTSKIDVAVGDVQDTVDLNCE